MGKILEKPSRREEEPQRGRERERERRLFFSFKKILATLFLS